METRTSTTTSTVHQSAVGRPTDAKIIAKRRLRLGSLLACLLMAFGTPPAKAADGCLVLLCFAAPSWRAIAQCVPPIQEVLRDLARGKPFPSCGMSGSGNSAENRRTAPDFCPVQYLNPVTLESGTAYYCGYDGAVSVTINGKLWTRTWWSLSGDSVTEYTTEAKTALGTWDTQFDADYAAWLAAQPPELPPLCPPSC